MEAAGNSGAAPAGVPPHGAAPAAEVESEEAKRAKQEDDAKTELFVNALTGITNGTKGLLRGHTRKLGKLRGRVMRPFKHQRTLVKRMINVEKRADSSAKNKSFVIAHAAGLGKTYSFLLFVAARYTLSRGNMPKVLITAPTAVLQQWHDAVLDTLRLREEDVLCTTRKDKMTRDAIDSVRVVITSQPMVGNVTRDCYERVTPLYQNERGNWCSGFDRRPNSALPALLDTAFDFVCVDEVHALRNPQAVRTFGHNLLAKKADFSVGISATLIFNRPDDLRGIATGINMPSHFQKKEFWYSDRKCCNLKVQSIREFAEHVDSVGEDALNLPPLTHEKRLFSADIKKKDVDGYNAILAKAKRLRVWMQRDGRGNQEVHLQLLGHLQRLQQYLFSPVIAEHGADELQKNPELVKQAAMEDTGSLRALKREVENLNQAGYKRIMVAFNNTSLMAVAKAYLDAECPSAGQLMSYDGSLTQRQRAEVPELFLTSPRAVLFLSISAGGTGLHLCPGCEVVIFCQASFSPMEELQATLTLTLTRPQP